MRDSELPGAKECLRAALADEDLSSFGVMDLHGAMIAVKDEFEKGMAWDPIKKRPGEIDIKWYQVFDRLQKARDEYTFHHKPLR